MFFYGTRNIYADGNIKNYVMTDDNNIVILHGKRDSFRCRQRNTDKSLKLISYNFMMKTVKRNNNRINGEFNFNTMSRL